jgi:hypothetical protein
MNPVEFGVQYEVGRRREFQVADHLFLDVGPILQIRVEMGPPGCRQSRSCKVKQVVVGEDSVVLSQSYV